MTEAAQLGLDFLGRTPSVVGTCDVCHEPIIEGDVFAEKFNEHLTCFVADMDQPEAVEQRPKFE